MAYYRTAPFIVRAFGLGDTEKQNLSTLQGESGLFEAGLYEVLVFYLLQ